MWAPRLQQGQVIFWNRNESSEADHQMATKATEEESEETCDEGDEKRAIMSATPQQAERHPLWETPPTGGDKPVKEAFNKKIKGALNMLYKELKIAHELHRDTSDIVTEISMRKRQIAATLPIESQIKGVERAIKRKTNTVGKLRMQEEHIAGQRRAAEEHLLQLNTSLNQLNEIKREPNLDANKADRGRPANDPMDVGNTARQRATRTDDDKALKRINEQLDYLTEAANKMMKNYMSSTPNQAKPTGPITAGAQSKLTDGASPPTRPIPKEPLSAPLPTGATSKRAAAPSRVRTLRAERARRTPTPPAEESPDIQNTGIWRGSGPGAATKAQRRTPTPPATHDAAEESPDEVITWRETSGIRSEPGPGAVIKATRRTAT